MIRRFRNPKTGKWVFYSGPPKPTGSTAADPEAWKAYREAVAAEEAKHGKAEPLKPDELAEFSLATSPARRRS